MNSPDFVVDWIPKKLFAQLTGAQSFCLDPFEKIYYALLMGSPAVTGMFMEAELGFSAKVPDGTRVNSGICVVLTSNSEKTIRTG